MIDGNTTSCTHLSQLCTLPHRKPPGAVQSLEPAGAIIPLEIEGPGTLHYACYFGSQRFQTKMDRVGKVMAIDIKILRLSRKSLVRMVGKASRDIPLDREVILCVDAPEGDRATLLVGRVRLVE